MEKINLICDSYFNSSGYANHSRGMFNALVEINPDTKLETPLPPNWEMLCNDKELKAIKQPTYLDGETVMIAMPQMWPMGMTEANKKFAGFCVWEGDKIPLGFVDNLKKADVVLVPSMHTKDAIVKTEFSLDTKIHLVPHGVNHDLFKPVITPKKETDGIFRFIANKGWRDTFNDRGGMQYLFKAFAEEFKPEEKVELIAKINTCYCGPDWDLGNEMNKLKLPPCASIKIITDNWDYKQIPDLYKTGDVFVSPTMAEGFSLPCAEAMAMGLPVITTNFGGQTDFVTKDNGWLIDYELKEVTTDIFYEGINWAMPDIAHLRKLMRWAYEHPEDVKKKGKQAIKDIASYTWESSARKLLEALK